MVRQLLGRLSQFDYFNYIFCFQSFGTFKIKKLVFSQSRSMNKIKTPVAQTKVTKVSPMPTNRVTTMATTKVTTTLSRQSPNPIKHVISQKQLPKTKAQNTSIKDLEQKLGQLGTILATIKTEPDKKYSPLHKQKQIVKIQVKKNGSEAGEKGEHLGNSTGVYRKETVRKTCPDIGKAFETSKMLLNPAEIINPRMTTDKNDKMKIGMGKGFGPDPYQLIDLANNPRKSFKANLEPKKMDTKPDTKVQTKKALKSNEHSTKNLNSVQKQQTKLRVTMSNNLLPKAPEKKQVVPVPHSPTHHIQSNTKQILDQSKAADKTMQQSAQSLPEIDNMRLSMFKQKKKIGEMTPTSSFIPDQAMKQEIKLATSRQRVNSPLLPDPKLFQQPHAKISDFQILKQLGSGKFSEVFLAVHKKSGFLVAIKKLSKQKVKKFNMIKQVIDEIKLHSQLNHPNIIKFFGLLQSPDSIYLILQFVQGGSLFDHLSQNDRIPIKQTTTYLRDIISAIQYLHDKSIAHRDIKPENILIGMGYVAKVCDLGWSALILTSRKTYCGTFDYVPPQILEKKDYDLSVDIWCLGILTYELLIGKVPYEGDKHTVVMSKINNAQIQFPNQSEQFPRQAKHYIQWLLQHNPNERPKSKQLLNHKFFQLAKEQVNHLKA